MGQDSFRLVFVLSLLPSTYPSFLPTFPSTGVHLPICHICQQLRISHSCKGETTERNR